MSGIIDYETLSMSEWSVPCRLFRLDADGQLWSVWDISPLFSKSDD